MTDLKTREAFTEERQRERAAARARFGARSVSDVLLTLRTRLRMLRDLSMGMEAGESELSSDGWVGLGDTLDDIIRDVSMLEDALPAEMHHWRPGESGDPS
jgi:hypothetical protein